jgi:hypothetical protein
VKTKADALGSLIRAGVAPADAAARAGLDDIEFTGAVPVGSVNSLRVRPDLLSTTTTAGEPRARAVATDIAVFQPYPAGPRRAQAVERLGKFGAPGSHQPGEANDLPGKHLEFQIIQEQLSVPFKIDMRYPKKFFSHRHPP